MPTRSEQLRQQGQVILGTPPEPAFSGSPVLSNLWQGLFGDPRVTQASVPDPKQAMARMIQLVQHLGKTGVRGSKVIPNLERNAQIIMKGQKGEKAVLELGDEFMDLVNIGAKKGVAPEFHQSIDDAAEILGLQYRRGFKTPTTGPAKKSIESAVKKGHMVEGGKHGGYLSTKQPLGRRLLEEQQQAAQGVMDPDLMNFIKTVGGQ